MYLAVVCVYPSTKIILVVFIGCQRVSITHDYSVYKHYYFGFR